MFLILSNFFMTYLIADNITYGSSRTTIPSQP